jgi:putative ABC transport system substrate-binding protein
MRKLWLLLMPLAFYSTAAAAEPSVQSHLIGFLGEDSLSSANIGALKKALGELGYDGQAVTIETRFAGGRIERLDDVAHELVQREVEVIVADGLSAGEAARRQTRTIPIVVASRTEVVKAVGNVTGATNLSMDLSIARLQLLKQIAPRISRVAILWHESNPIAPAYPKKLRSTAQSLGVEIEPHKIRLPRFEAEFDAIAGKPGAGILIEAQPIFAGHLVEIARLCLKGRLPAVAGVREFAEAGGLISYGLSVAEMWSHTAFLIDKIFARHKPKAGKPIELPAAQPTKFELAINLNTAGQLRIAVPPDLLARATRVVR